MIESIELGEHCYGEFLKVNGENVIIGREDYSSLNEPIASEILNTLTDLKNNLDLHDWYKIGKIILRKSNNFKYIKDNSTHEYCENCNDFNAHNFYQNVNYTNK